MINITDEPDGQYDHEPRWPAAVAALAVGGLYTSLPTALTFGPRWLFPGIVWGYLFRRSSLTVSASIDGALIKQAGLLAYVDTFRWMALGCLLCVPLVLLFKKAKARGPVAAH